jgi:Tfp pilus assembly protein PilF
MDEAEEYLDNNEFELALDALEDIIGDKEDERLEKARSIMEALEEEEGETEEAVQALWQAVEFDCIDEEE